MGAAASSRSNHKFAKVEIDSVDGQEAEIFHVNDASIFVGVGQPKLASSNAFGITIAESFQRLSGINVETNTFVDRSQAQLLISRTFPRDKDLNESNKKKPSPSQYYLVPRIEPFSRISGVCKILGDREVPSKEKYNLLVGDYLRVGSVGLVVTEICTSAYEKPKMIEDSHLWYLKPRAYSMLAAEKETLEVTMGTAISISPNVKSSSEGFVDYPNNLNEESDDESNNTARGTLMPSDEEGENSNHHAPTSSSMSSKDAAAAEEQPLCYACCDDSNITYDKYDNPLVSACKCIGGTKWLHLKCLERMLSGSSDETCVVFHNQRHKPVCKVCREEYESQCLLTDSHNVNDKPRIVTIAMPSFQPPYICFKVVTDNAHNISQQSIFNSSFVVSFASLLPPANTSPNSSADQGPGVTQSWPLLIDHPNPSEDHGINNHSPLARPAAQKLTARKALVIGRSLDVDVPLNYQTVSGRHAALHFEQGIFKISDLKSSNGTFLYLRKPLPLPSSTPVRIRMGRRTLTVSTVSSLPTQASNTSNTASSNTSTNLPSSSPSQPTASSSSGHRIPHTYVVAPNPNLSPNNGSSTASNNTNLSNDDTKNNKKKMKIQFEGQNSSDNDIVAPTYDTLMGLMQINKPMLMPYGHSRKNKPSSSSSSSSLSNIIPTSVERSRFQSNMNNNTINMARPRVRGREFNDEEEKESQEEKEGEEEKEAEDEVTLMPMNRSQDRTHTLLTTEGSENMEELQMLPNVSIGHQRVVTRALSSSNLDTELLSQDDDKNSNLSP